MAAQEISTTRKTVPPTFAVQRAGGGKARIIALHTAWPVVLLKLGHQL
jgi:hypothetical protein